MFACQARRVPKDPADLVLPILESLLGDGEELRGWCLGTEQSTFSGHTTILGITERRLVLQPVDRKFRPKGDPSSIRPGELARAEADGAGAAWWNTTAPVMDAAALVVVFETTNGERRRLTMMRGGDALFGRLGGGAPQQRGIDALAGWLRAAG
jgi:hypothetical protein